MNPTEDGFSWALQRIQKEESGSSQGMQRETCGGVRRRTKTDMLHQAVYSLG